MEREYFVYILSNESRMLYIGVTNDIERRMAEHKLKLFDGYAKKYNLTRLVYFEDFYHVVDAIAREKELKGWLRRRKIALIEAGNPQWEDLAREWIEV